MTALRPGDQATATILAMQDELTALGLLPPGDAPRARLGRKVTRISDSPSLKCDADAGYRADRKAS